MKFNKKLLISLIFGLVLSGLVLAADQTAFEKHGKLSVNGAYLVDEHGEKVQLRGMSTHGIAWYPKFVCEETLTYLRDEWNTNCIRLAMYTFENLGYCTNGDKKYIKSLVTKGVDIATDLGMYAIVDWHVLNEHTPLKYKEEAVEFFDEISAKYADNPHVIYEICNEPNYSSWADICTYANLVIPVIRKNAPDAVIIVGTPNWSQEIQEALKQPLPYDNLMYTLHFYAATHKEWLRDRMVKCIKSGLPVFISEFGMCDASGNGKIDVKQSNAWKKVIDDYNVSYMCWNMANKNESSSILVQNCRKLSNWGEKDLSEQGRIIQEWFKNEED